MEQEGKALTPERKKRGRRKKEVSEFLAMVETVAEPPQYTAPPVVKESPQPQVFIPPPPPPPEPIRKIAVLGSAISSVGFAPFNDPSWEIWACSPANKGIPRWDVWFELHNVEQKKKEGLTEYLEWMSKQPKPVYMQAALPDYPNSRSFPLMQMIEKWGPFWWTSQLSYMLALALEQKPYAIGIYGVDMAANSEYNQQRLAAQFFIREILKANINIIVPPESDILEPAPLYGYCESSRQWRKYNARMQELGQRVTNLNNEINAKSAEKAHLIGAIDDMEYHLAHWANRRDFY